MTQSTLRKKEILTPRLRLVAVERTPEEWLDLEFREAVVALATAPGAERPRRFYKIAASELLPLHVIARVVRDGIEAGVTEVALLRAVWRPLARFIARVQAEQRPSHRGPIATPPPSPFNHPRRRYTDFRAA